MGGNSRLSKMPKFKSGQPVKAADLNRLSEAIERQSRGLSVGEVSLGTGVYRVPTGKTKIGKCPQWWFLQLFPGAGGIASSGSFSLDYDAEDKDGATVSGSITVPYDVGLTDFQTLLESEPNLVDADSILVVSLKGGPLERVAIAIGNKKATGQRITELDWSSSTLDSGQPYIIPWRPV